ncbi:hydroxymethylglutaryl-CoA lyase [Desulfonema ishimotonii]|uniref:Hydroxymethylglutaryl-CoA lyase n=1 Tax=Desulfonema ishimotonii TaxID=45657 RepID=A0A401FRZ9_9BACT|nr:hydroxymethylglutaryl-CoA lyase [Desulfonema ishimotonii]GBC59736.1 hydroxymethylglutaryl-CoA lyase [Desulfonema ishimotonii]
MAYPKRVRLAEVGPRDGFQSERKIIPTDLKVKIITALAEAGSDEIQVTSFVNPARVPQMADAEELIRRLPRREGLLYTALALNTRGVERACQAGLTGVEVSISASDTHSRKNAGMSHLQAREQAREMVRLARECRMQVTGSIQCAFGCVYEGDVSAENVTETARMFLDAGVHRLSLADTTGMATPLSVEARVRSLATETEALPLGLHLHDTRGLGLVNLMAGLAAGGTCFDTAFGGMGGCPFVRGASGNIATEDTVYLLETLNIECGIDRQQVAACSEQMAAFLGRPLPGKLYRLNR